MTSEILELEVHNKTDSKKKFIIPVFKIINVIHEYDENIDLTLMGSTETLVDVQDNNNKSKLLTIIKTILVCIVLFLGAGLAIINFHADVNMDQSLQIIYHMVTGKENNKPLILLIPYSLGIGTGMLVFFNHVFQRKLQKEPSPLEVEMFLYQKNMDNYILDGNKDN